VVEGISAAISGVKEELSGKQIVKGVRTGAPWEDVGVEVIGRWRSEGRSPLKAIVEHLKPLNKGIA
jgi:hypothetical protein